MRGISSCALDFVIISTAIFTSCSSRNGEVGAAATDDLFKESVSLLTQYCDSLKSARDSAEVLRLSEDYEEKVTRLNFNYPADAALEMSEGQNDTLISCTRQYCFLRDSILHSFMKRSGVSEADSVR